MSTSSAEKQKLSRTQVILIVGIVLILAVLGVIAVLLLQKPEPAATPGSGNVVIDEDNFSDVIADLNRKAQEGMFEVKMVRDWNFADGTSVSSDAKVSNSEANRHPMFFEVTLAETGDLVYTSPTVPVGSAVKDIVLLKDLDAGEYEAVLTYHLLDEANNNAELTTASVAVTLHIAG